MRGGWGWSVRIGIWGWAGLLCATVLLVPSWPVAAAQGEAVPPGIDATTLATRLLNEVPAGRRWVVRRRHPLNDDAHAHAGGFIYAARGRSYLIVDDTQGSLMEEGRAIWAPEGIGHLHTTPFRASSSGRADDGTSEVWTILLERDVDLRQAGAAALSPPLIGLRPGAYEARLVSVAYQPGAATALRRRAGPELAYTLEGAWALEYAGVPFTFGADRGYLADPGVPHRLRNVGTEPARVLSALLVPTGQPDDEPNP
jgi:quercetin dioxygenase-like cupin family protein